MALEISPSSVSEAVAPCSVYVSPCVKLILASPINVITGTSPNETSILLTAVVVFPSESTTVYVTS